MKPGFFNERVFCAAFGLALLGVALFILCGRVGLQP